MIGQEEEPGLGNAGLARLASCFMDSLAFFEVPAVGYSMLAFVRPQIHYDMKFGGHAEVNKDERGRYQVRWLPDTEANGDACADSRLPRRDEQRVVIESCTLIERQASLYRTVEKGGNHDDDDRD